MSNLSNLTEEERAIIDHWAAIPDYICYAIEFFLPQMRHLAHALNDARAAVESLKEIYQKETGNHAKTAAFMLDARAEAERLTKERDDARVVAAKYALNAECDQGKIQDLEAELEERKHCSWCMPCKDHEAAPSGERLVIRNRRKHGRMDLNPQQREEKSEKEDSD